ncbi:chemosensory receptor A [Elysia marginata]|uniref:Chemosensory receptor A n=1 Tax=Elysia marginata TaxID=1093978 RepID=A0AAV4ECE7_9GAST|nr:chemosensory receptor A [Elysia marginata]
MHVIHPSVPIFHLYFDQVMLLTLFPAYMSIQIDWTFIPEKNRTLLGLVVSDDRDEIEGITVALNVGMQLLFFCFIVGSNAILIYELQNKTKWRQNAVAAVPKPNSRYSSTAARSSGNDNIMVPLSAGVNPAGSSRFLSVPGEAPESRLNLNGGQDVPSAAAQAASRDRKLARMIVFLSAILFVCYLPSTICLVTQLVQPEFSITRGYENIFFVGWSFAWVADAINSSVNIFVYYNMSTKYRLTFQALFSSWHRKWRRVGPHAGANAQSNVASGSSVRRLANIGDKSPVRQDIENLSKLSSVYVSAEGGSVTPSTSSMFQLSQKSQC